MAGMLWAVGLSLLVQGCWCSVGETNSGCLKWTQDGDNVCCHVCYPGHHLVKECGPNPKTLCTPCGPGTFTTKPKDNRCTRCTQCVGAQVYVKPCTPTSDTKCGCAEGLTCGDDDCNFCVKRCDRGQEPAEKRSCRPCPQGTFNDQIHQKCKPWSTKCPHPDQTIVAKGDARTDIMCANVSIVHKPKKPDSTEPAWPLGISVTSVLLVASGLVIIGIVAKKIFQKRAEDGKKPKIKTPIIRTPTDDPRTLIAIECSFHEAQQEQGSSSESIASSDQLIA